MYRNEVFDFGYLCQDKNLCRNFIIIKTQPHYDLLWDSPPFSKYVLYSMKLVYCLPIRYPNDTPVGKFDRCLMAPMRKESAYRLAYYRVEEANMPVVHVVSLLVLNMSSCPYSSTQFLLHLMPRLTCTSLYHRQFHVLGFCGSVCPRV
jgi:hypothetical protein